MSDIGAARRALRTLAVTLVVSGFAAAPAAADTAYISGNDSRNCWMATDGVSEYGNCIQALVGTSAPYEYRGLLQFDIAAHVPDTAVVTDAYLRLPLNGWDEEDICDSGLHLRAQYANWLTQTPTWTTPDGTTLWDGGESTWSHIVTSAGACDENGVIFDVTGQVGDWALYPEQNLGWSLLNNTGTPFGVGNTYTDIPELVVEYEE